MEKFPLNPILSPIDREERLLILENWTRITSYFNHLQNQLKALAGGKEIDEIIQSIIIATENAELKTEEMRLLIIQVEQKMSEINLATKRANDAADDANALNVALTTLKSQLEALQSDLSDIVNSENQRIQNENKRISNEDERILNESERLNAEDNRILKEQEREISEQNRATIFDANMLTAEQKITMMQYLIDNLASFDYDPVATFNFPNLIKWNGSTFITLQEVTGVTPADDGINYRLVAQRGVDGTGAVSSVNGIGPDENGNVEVIMSLVNNLVSDSTTAGLTAAQGKALKVLFDGLQQALNLHIGAMDNPHQVTAEQLALGNVQNFGVATQVDAEVGSSSTTYMTPQRTKQAIDKNLIPLQEQVAKHLEEIAGYVTFTSTSPKIIPNNTTTNVLVDVVTPSNGGVPVYKNSSGQILASKDGIYRITARVRFSPSDAKVLRLSGNNATVDIPSVVNKQMYLMLVAEQAVSAGNVLRVQCEHDATTTLQIDNIIILVRRVS